MTLLSAIMLLFSNAVTFRRDKSILYNRGTIIISFCGFILASQFWVLSFLVVGIGVFAGLFHITSVSLCFHIFIYILVGIIVQLTAFYPRKVTLGLYDNPYYKIIYDTVYNSDFINKSGEQFKIIEYPLVILFIVSGGLFLMSSCDIVSIFLSIELQSYGLYLLITFYKNSELSTSAGLIYFLLGGLSSCFILLGTSLLYANSGLTILDGHYIITNISSTAEYVKYIMSSLYDFSYINISLLILSIGLLFKTSAAPFHHWSPDVYDAIPTIVTTFVAIIAKISILVLLLELILFTGNIIITDKFNWSFSLVLSCILSFIIGTILGLSQPRIKRLFAYSTISHLGFILLAIAINTMESIEAFIFYIQQYSLSNLNAFIILTSIGFSLYHLNYKDKDSYEKESGDLPERNNSPIQLTTELKGYFHVNPLLALSLAITLFSFIGIPPLMGFFAKQMVLSSAISSGYFFIAIIAILTSVISASYYLNIVKEIFFYDTNLIVNKEFKNKTFKHISTTFKNKVITDNFDVNSLSLSSFLTFSISCLTLLLLLFMFASQEWLSMTRLLSLLILNT